MTLPKKLKKEARQLMVYVSLVFLLALVVLLFDIDLIALITILVLFVIGSFSKIYKRFSRISVGFEFITPIVILFAYQINILFACLAAFLMLLFASFIAGSLDFPSIMCEEIVYVVLALFAYLFSFTSFVPLAITLVITRNVLLAPLGVLLLGRDFVRIGIVVISNLILNIFVVLQFGDLFVSLLAF